MSNEYPEYLLKFVSKEEHAKVFQNGIMYTRPAGYYHYLENGRGDEKEASVLENPKSIKMYKCAEHPIYCMYSAYKCDISGGYINNIDIRCIENFEANYIAIIKFFDMLSVIKELKLKAGCDIQYGIVQYRNRTFEDEFTALTSKSIDHLFIKSPDFNYQKEFRIVFCENIPFTISENSHTYKVKYNAKEYRFSDCYKSKIKIYSIDAMTIGADGMQRLKIDF